MTIFRFSFHLFLFLLFVHLSACVDDTFDSPKPIPVPDTNTTIADLIDRYKGEQINFDQGEVFKGTVISSDEQGNFFETLYLQDGDAAIAIRADVNSLYAEYPLGSEVVVSLDGIFMSDFAGLIQIDGLTETNIKQHLFRKSLQGSVDTMVVSNLSELNLSLVPRLVRLEGVEFEDIGATYAVEGGGGGQNRNVADCDGNTLTVRNSDFADFAGQDLPIGNGSITGVFTRFRDFIQLVISSPDDVDMSEVRCGAGTGTETLIDISTLRALYNGVPTNAPDEKKIRGVVISDFEAQNTTGRNLHIQDASGGIVVRFDGIHPFAVHTELEFVVSNSEISEFNGLLQLNNVSLSRASVMALNVDVQPKTKTIQELLSDFENLESTLVRIDNPTFSGSGTFAGSVDVSDATGSIVMFTRSQAVFAEETLPEKADAITAIVTQGGGSELMQLSIRNLSDLDNPTGGGGGGGSDGTIPFSEDFSGGIPSSWTVTNTVGTRSWNGRDFNDVYYANMSAFSSGDILDVVTWLITPQFDFDAQTGEKLELIIADAFRNGNPLTLMYSTDYSGGDPTTAGWTPIGNDQIDPLINNSGTYDNVYESTGDIDLSSLTGKAHLAIVYSSQGATVSTTIQISDVIIRKD